MQWCFLFKSSILFLSVVSISGVKVESQKSEEEDGWGWDSDYSDETSICTSNEHCNGWGGGVNIRCNKQTGDCECFDKSGGGQRNVISVNGVCYTKKYIGEQCTSSYECEDADSMCTGTCRCPIHYIYAQKEKSCLPKAHKIGDPCLIYEQCYSLGGLTACLKDTKQCNCSSEAIYFNESECLPKARKIGDPCKIHEQCQLLGKHFVCRGNTKKCGCSSETAYLDQRGCFPRKQYNDTCDKDDECQASLGQKVLCNYVKNYRSLGIDRNTKICLCIDGKVCRSYDYVGTSPQHISSTVLLISMFIIVNVE